MILANTGDNGYFAGLYWRVLTKYWAFRSLILADTGDTGYFAVYWWILVILGILQPHTQTILVILRVFRPDTERCW